MFDLQPPRHISTLRNPAFCAGRKNRRAGGTSPTQSQLGMRQLALSDTMIYRRQNLLGGVDEVGIRMLLAIKAQPAAVGVG